MAEIINIDDADAVGHEGVTYFRTDGKFTVPEEVAEHLLRFPGWEPFDGESDFQPGPDRAPDPEPEIPLYDHEAEVEIPKIDDPELQAILEAGRPN